LSVSAPTHSERPAALVSYFDIAVLLVATPVALLIGVPAAGYLAGAGAWIGLRLAGVGIERVAGAVRDARTQISLRLVYMLGRLFALAITVIIVRQDAGKDDALTALAVIVFAFTIQLGIGAVNRPRTR
jgi:hypothetical protein